MKRPNHDFAWLLIFFALFIPSQALTQAGSLTTAYGDTTLALNHANHAKYLLDGAPVDAGLVPASLIRVDESVENLVWVEMEKGLLHLMVLNESNNQWQVGFTRPISIGKSGYGKEYEGDNRTPVGLSLIHI